MNLSEIKKIHFVGIGGIGMSGLAEVLSQRGFSVSGCDLRPSASTALLTSRGVHVAFGHNPAHAEGVDLMVVTSAVQGVNAETDAARERGIRVRKRSEVLGDLVNESRSIGVAGTHGKTSTSAMLSVVLNEAGLDPTILVGGMIRNLGTNARSGTGELLVVEADEYDRTFHQLHPEIAIVTNIEADHLEYYGSLEAIVEAFEIFVRGVKRGGVVAGCVDDPAVATLLDRLGSTAEGRGLRRIIRYGLSEEAAVRATNLQVFERGTAFEVPGLGFYKLFTPGKHNVCNALGVIAVAEELGIPSGVVSGALAKFLGVDRRFQILGESHGALVIDDYAHHPTEISATLAAARAAYPDRRLVALFQPHLFSRTRDFAGAFARALSAADLAFVIPIFASRERPVEGISAALIAGESPRVEFLNDTHSAIVTRMRDTLRTNDVFVAMGAGDVHEIAEALVEGAK